MNTDLPLQNRSIVITRPAHQAHGISQRLRESGAQVINFPLLAITGPRDEAHCKSQLAQLSEYDILIFTSPNAVEMALARLPEVFPESSVVATVGHKTAETLNQYNIPVSIVPDTTFNSEALLNCQALQAVSGQSIAIIHGEGGRRLLYDTLTQRGASVEYIDVYRRICPASDLLPLVKYRETTVLDIIVLTSVESLNNLLQLGQGQAWLEQTALLLGSERIRQMALDAGHKGALFHTEDPSDDSIYTGLLDWANNKKDKVTIYDGSNV